MENGFLPVYGMTCVMRPQHDISSQLEIYPIISTVTFWVFWCALASSHPASQWRVLYDVIIKTSKKRFFHKFQFSANMHTHAPHVTREIKIKVHDNQNSCTPFPHFYLQLRVKKRTQNIEICSLFWSPWCRVASCSKDRAYSGNDKWRTRCTTRNTIHTIYRLLIKR